jgi:Tol biopolymer transport system component
MRPDGTGLQRVTNDGGGNIVSGWSPDGSQLLYSHSQQHSDYGWDIWTTGVDGSGAKQLTDWPGFDGSGVFAPDGKHIAFASDRFGNDATVKQGEGGGHATDGLDVYVLSLADGSVERITSYAPLMAWPSGWEEPQ